MDSLSLTCFLSVIASIVLLVVSPHLAITPDSQALRGIFAHKNLFGQVVAAGVFATLHQCGPAGQDGSRGVFALLLYVTVAYYSQSGTSFIVIFALCIVRAIVSLYETPGISRLFGAIVSFVLTPIVVMIAWDRIHF